jgi:hypothetical protein
MEKSGLGRKISTDLLAVIMFILSKIKMTIKKLEKPLTRQLRTNNYYLILNNKIKEKLKDKEDRLFLKLVTILK